MKQTDLSKIRVLYRDHNLQLWGIPYDLREGQSPRHLQEAYERWTPPRPGKVGGSKQIDLSDWRWLGSPGWWGSMSPTEREEVESFLEKHEEYVPGGHLEFSELPPTNGNRASPSTFKKGDRVYVESRHHDAHSGRSRVTDRHHGTVVTGNVDQRLWEGVGRPDRRKEPHLLVRLDDSDDSYWVPVADLKVDRSHNGASNRVETRDYEYVVFPSTRVEGEGVRVKATNERGVWRRDAGLAAAKALAKSSSQWGSGIYSVSSGRFVGWINRNGRFVPFRR